MITAKEVRAGINPAPTVDDSNTRVGSLPRFLTKGNLDYFSFLTKVIVMLISGFCDCAAKL